MARLHEGGPALSSALQTGDLLREINRHAELVVQVTKSSASVLIVFIYILVLNNGNNMNNVRVMAEQQRERCCTPLLLSGRCTTQNYPQLPAVPQPTPQGVAVPSTIQNREEFVRSVAAAATPGHGFPRGAAGTSGAGTSASAAAGGGAAGGARHVAEAEVPEFEMAAFLRDQGGKLSDLHAPKAPQLTELSIKDPGRRALAASGDLFVYNCYTDALMN